MEFVLLVICAASQYEYHISDRQINSSKFLVIPEPYLLVTLTYWSIKLWLVTSCVRLRLVLASDILPEGYNSL